MVITRKIKIRRSIKTRSIKFSCVLLLSNLNSTSYLERIFGSQEPLFIVHCLKIQRSKIIGSGGNIVDFDQYHDNLIVHASIFYPFKYIGQSLFHEIRSEYSKLHRLANMKFYSSYKIMMRTNFSIPVRNTWKDILLWSNSFKKFCTYQQHYEKGKLNYLLLHLKITETHQHQYFHRKQLSTSEFHFTIIVSNIT